jgi:hypothetical protein
VYFYTVAAVRLKGPLGHEITLQFLLENLRFGSIFEYTGDEARNPVSFCMNAFAPARQGACGVRKNCVPGVQLAKAGPGI